MVAALGLGRALGGLVHGPSTRVKGCTAPGCPKQPVRDQVCYHRQPNDTSGPPWDPPGYGGTLQSDLAWLRQGWTSLQETCAQKI